MLPGVDPYTAHQVGSARHRRDAQATQGHANQSMNTSKELRHEGRATQL